MKKLLIIFVMIISTSCASYYQPIVNGQRMKIKIPHYKTEFHKYVLNMR